MEKDNSKKFDANALLKKAGGKIGEYNFVVIFLVLFFAYWIINANMNATLFTNIFRHSAIVGIMALGMGLVIITGGIDLSVGSMMALTAGLACNVFNATENLAVVLLFCIVFAGLCGLMNGILIGKLKMPPFIVTLATMLIFRSLAQFILALDNLSTYQLDRNDTYDALKSLGDGSTLGIPNIAWILFIATAILVYVASSTKYGKAVYALGSNERAAKLAGIKSDWMRVSVYGIAGLLVGLSAFIWVISNRSVSAGTAGSSYEMYAIAAVVIGGISMSGGKGKIIGVLFGAMSYTVIDKIISALKMNAYINDTVKGTILLIAVAVQIAIPYIKTYMANKRQQEKLQSKTTAE